MFSLLSRLCPALFLSSSAISRYDTRTLPNDLYRSRFDQQTITNREDVKSLMVQVGDLAKVLENPVPKGQARERRRREELGR